MSSLTFLALPVNKMHFEHLISALDAAWVETNTVSKYILCDPKILPMVGLIFEAPATFNFES